MENDLKYYVINSYKGKAPWLNGNPLILSSSILYFILEEKAKNLLAIGEMLVPVISLLHVKQFPDTLLVISQSLF